LQARLVEAVEKGNYVCTACDLVGISTPTYYDWKMRGDKGEEPFSSFLSAIKEAEAKAEDNALQVIQGANKDSWQSAAWYLERRKPDRWGKKERIEHSGNKEKPVALSIDYKKLKDDDLRELDRILESTRSEGSKEGTS